MRTKFPGVPVLSVRTDGEIPKDKLMEAMRELSQVIIEEELSCGDTVLEDIAGTGVRVIVTSFALMQLGAELENKNAELSRRSGLAGGASAAVRTDTGVGVVGRAENLEEPGSDTVGGFVGAAGQAVGVEGAEEEDAEEDLSPLEDNGGLFKQKGRSHIKRGL